MRSASLLWLRWLPLPPVQTGVTRIRWLASAPHPALASDASDSSHEGGQPRTGSARVGSNAAAPDAQTAQTALSQWLAKSSAALTAHSRQQRLHATSQVISDLGHLPRAAINADTSVSILSHITQHITACLRGKTMPAGFLAALSHALVMQLPLLSAVQQSQPLVTHLEQLCDKAMGKYHYYPRTIPQLATSVARLRLRARLFWDRLPLYEAQHRSETFITAAVAADCLVGLAHNPGLSAEHPAAQLVMKRCAELADAHAFSTVPAAAAGQALKAIVRLQASGASVPERLAPCLLSSLLSRADELTLEQARALLVTWARLDAAVDTQSHPVLMSTARRVLSRDAGGRASAHKLSEAAYAALKLDLLQRDRALMVSVAEQLMEVAPELRADAVPPVLQVLDAAVHPDEPTGCTLSGRAALAHLSASIVDAAPYMQGWQVVACLNRCARLARPQGASGRALRDEDGGPARGGDAGCATPPRWRQVAMAEDSGVGNADVDNANCDEWAGPLAGSDLEVSGLDEVWPEVHSRRQPGAGGAWAAGVPAAQNEGPRSVGEETIRVSARDDLSVAGSAAGAPLQQRWPFAPAADSAIRAAVNALLRAMERDAAELPGESTAAVLAAMVHLSAQPSSGLAAALAKAVARNFASLRRPCAATVLWSVAHLPQVGLPDKLLVGLAGVVAAGAEHLEPRLLARALWAVARVRGRVYAANRHPRAFMHATDGPRAKLSAVAIRRAHKMGPRSVAATTWSLTSLATVPGTRAVARPYLLSVARVVGDMNAWELTATLSGLGRKSREWGKLPGVLERLLVERVAALAVQREFTGHELALSWRGLAALRLQLDGWVLHALQREVARLVDRMGDIDRDVLGQAMMYYNLDSESVHPLLGHEVSSEAAMAQLSVRFRADR